ncbi:hypothetical protein LA080_009510 [Diaporthe eres]|nr:hypothetical protein LA080_009510 [Diaporthe eres]
MASATYSPQYLAGSRTAVLNTFYSIPIPLEILSTSLRLWSVRTREADAKRLRFDDYLMIWATTVAIAVCIAGLVYGAPYGLGRHVEAVSSQDLQTFMLGNYIFSHFYDAAIVSTKLSVLALYYRVFVIPTFRTIIIVTAVFILMWLVTMEVVLGLECRPIHAWWGATEGSCVNQVAFGYFTNITNLASDMWIFLLPIPTILRLQTSRYRKISLCFLFSVGLGTCVISGARLSVIVSMGATDITWDEVPLGILSAWEPCGGILCANIPMIYRAFSKMVESASSANGPSGGSLDFSNHKRPHDGSNWLPLNESRSFGEVGSSSLH